MSCATFSKSPGPTRRGPTTRRSAYVFERAVPFPNPDGSTTVKRIDLYKRDCFVLEAKQGSDKVAESDAFTLAPPKRLRRGTAVRGTAGWDAAMYEAKGQAELYVRNLPATEHNPPFLSLDHHENRRFLAHPPVADPPLQR